MKNNEENFNSLHIVNKGIEDKYFANGEIIQKIFDVVRKNFILKDSLFGNYAADTIIAINLNESKLSIIEERVKEFYDRNGADFYDIYLTLYEKTNDDMINNKLLEKEIQIIKPRKIIYLGFDNCSGPALSEKELEILVSGISDFNKKDTPEYKYVNDKFKLLMEYAALENKMGNIS
ncbi:hypothetical protein [Clostridium saccharoperbutylacetonicum]